MKRSRSCLLMALLTLCLGYFAPHAATAADLHVSPGGKPDGDGTEQKPLDLITALGLTDRVKPGDTVWLAGGTYRHPMREGDGGWYNVTFQGTTDKPVHIRAKPGERVTIDGGIRVLDPSKFVWIRDLEITVTEPRKEVKEKGSWPSDLGRPAGGLEVRGGEGGKYINLVIHNCAGGISLWTGAINAEVYGCLVYDNGWQGPDRHHGHAIYTQNKDGTKTISNNIMYARRETTDGSYSLHAYGSPKASVDNFVVEDNVFAVGPALMGGEGVSRNNRVLRNFTGDTNLMLGYTWSKEAVDYEVRDNVVIDGRLVYNNCTNLKESGNIEVIHPAPRLTEIQTALLPNKYDPGRAHLVVVNWPGKAEVTAPVAPFLKKGDRFRLMSPIDFFGKPVMEGTCEGETLTVPTPKGLNAYVLLKLNRASEPAGVEEDQAKFETIFNGKDLTGWVSTGCVTEVADGVLVTKDGNGFIRYDKELTDFVLEVEWKPLRDKEYDSGIYFRAPLPTDQPWPERYQINLKEGDEGNLIGSEAGRSEGLVKRGEWNKFTLRVEGKTASLEINGKPAWKTDEIEPAKGYIGIQVEVPGGGQYEFRNIRLKTL